jgi:hypothetical protein
LGFGFRGCVGFSGSAAASRARRDKQGKQDNSKAWRE